MASMDKQTDQWDNRTQRLHNDKGEAYKYGVGVWKSNIRTDFAPTTGITMQT